MRLLRHLCTTTILLLVAAAPVRGDLDPALLSGMAARSIGPATMSGRVAAIEVSPHDHDQVWVGAATGGVWRSDDGGLTWTPVFDDQPVAAIGAVRVSPSNPDRVWVGTGEGNPRNSASVGNGVYRSDDGGETWRHLGLTDSERIHRIALSPTDPDVAWVCAMGPTWGDGGERGVYRTRDGGATWKQVLAGANPTTGCADLERDPANPQKLFAALWDHRRWPWSFRSGGPGSGLYVSHDGGDTWDRVTADDGLPAGDLGRIGLAVAPSQPRAVYAYVEAKKNGVYRSGDGGRTWKLVSDQPAAGSRPFYFADLRVDPQAPGRVYSLWSLVSVSDDGGRDFRVLVPFNAAHPDHHAMWIDPDDPRHIWLGNDGGAYESRDRGGSWRFVANLPLAQLYHVRSDDDDPYHVYFGLQDNGSWRGPAEVRENGGIRNHHWQEIYFGDGFDAVPMPGDGRRGYAMSQEGYVARWDVDTGERKSVRPAPAAEPLRFNWNAAIALDPFDPDAVYFGSQYVHRSRDRGETWEVISPDLTSDNPDWQHQDESGGLTLDVTGAENFTTLVALALSPVAPGVIWAGSDDGRLHVSRDGGEHWTRVDGNVRGVPADTWIPHVAPSPHDAATAFVVFDNHRRSDWTPYVYRTTDYGATWTRLVHGSGDRSLAGDGVRGYTLSILQDPVDPQLLFLGTEFGLWLSVDGGATWQRFTHGLPTVSVMDLAFQDRESDLVIATHGRGVYVIDDVTPLRRFDPAALAEPLHLFSVADAQQYRVAQTGSSRFPGAGEFRGANEPYGAVLTFSAAGEDLPYADEAVEKERREARRQAAETAADETAADETAAAEKPGGEQEATEEEPGAGKASGKDEEGPKVEIEIRDATGEVIRSFEADVHQGVNRAVWDLNRDAFDEPDPGDLPRWNEPSGPEVVPGAYTATVRLGDAEVSSPLHVLADPRFEIPAADRQAKQDALLRLGALQETLTAAIERIRRTRKDTQTALERYAEQQEEDEGGDGDGAGADDALKSSGEKLLTALDDLEHDLWTPPGSQDIPAETKPWDDVNRGFWLLSPDWSAPTAAQHRYLEIAEQSTAAAVDQVNVFFAEEVAPFRQQVRAAEIELLPEEEPLAMP